MIGNLHAEVDFENNSIQESFPSKPVASFIRAVINNNFNEAGNLIKSGVDINSTGLNGITPLLWVMSTTKDLRKIEFLLNSGANPNYRDNKNQTSAMFFAAGGDEPKILELLLKNGGNPDLLGPRGENLLMIAISQSRDENLKMLLDYGANVNFYDHHNDTVANKAARYGRFDLIAALLNRGLTHNMQELAKDVEINTIPADSEQQQWKVKVIEMLKERGATFPAFVRCYPPSDPRRKEEDCKRFKFQEPRRN